MNYSTRIFFSIVVLVVLSLGNIKAQTIYFHYDNVGNRTERSISNSPSSSRSLVQSDSTLIEEVATEEFETMLYPNASDGLFFIRMGEYSGVVELYVFDIRGRMIYKDNYDQSEIRFDITEQPSGLYVVKWRNREKSYIEKVLKR
ncbi:T9SS type A sorting domain-containing protein [Reichenbachiella sp.]|uniref:T9SS type A sorting domain-containing protein n=1 Tax=Reichenbachiella sp. TaxID=2184521 RepID=UPI003BB1A48D